jgi:hypothetical protein
MIHNLFILLALALLVAWLVLYQLRGYYFIGLPSVQTSQPTGCWQWAEESFSNKKGRPQVEPAFL